MVPWEDKGMHMQKGKSTVPAKRGGSYFYFQGEIQEAIKKDKRAHFCTRCKCCQNFI